MFVKKTRHFSEFALVLFIACVFAYVIMKAITLISLPHNDLEFDPNADATIESLIDSE